MKKDRLSQAKGLTSIQNVVIKQHFLNLSQEKIMDSQEQYEALLKRWGFEDRSIERRFRREKAIRSIKTSIVFLKALIQTIKNSSQTASTSH